MIALRATSQCASFGVFIQAHLCTIWTGKFAPAEQRRWAGECAHVQDYDPSVQCNDPLQHLIFPNGEFPNCYEVGPHCSLQLPPSVQNQHCVKGFSFSLYNESYIQNLCHQGQLEHAANVLSHIGQPVAADTYMCLLRACNKGKLVDSARQVCKHLMNHNAQPPPFLGNYLVVTLAKCGAIADAYSLLKALPSRTVYSWTALISAHAFSGHAEEAIKMHTLMVNDGVKPSSHTYVSLLKACGILGNLQKGRELHDEILVEGFAYDVFVGSTLISMYGKCGEILEAEVVFVALAQRNIVTWNAMLSVYVDQGQGRKALQCYRQMQEDRVGSDQRTFLFALQACDCCVEQENLFSVERWPTARMLVYIIQSLYSDAQREGFTSDVFVGSTFVRMLGKCGTTAEAEHAFSSLANRNVVSWTALLAGYIEHHEGVKALQLYKQMHAEGLYPDRLAAVSALQACCSLVDTKELVKGISNKTIALEIGHAVGGDIPKEEAAGDSVFLTALQTMYGKCGDIVEAENTFGAMSERSIVSWNALLAVFVGHGHMEKTLQLYRQMHMEGECPGRHAIVSALQAVCSLASREEIFDVEGESEKLLLLGIGYGLHCDARSQGVLSDMFVGNTLVNMYGKCGAVRQAEAVFLAMPHRNVVSWTAMLSTYLEQGQGSSVLQLYGQMLRKGIAPDHLTLVIVFQGCGMLAGKEEAAGNGKGNKIMAMEIGQALFNDWKKLAIEFGSLVHTALINLYGRCGAIAEAENIFKQVEDPDVVAWSAMLSAYVDQGHGEKGLLLYRQMHHEGIQLDPVTTVIVLQACSILAEMETTILVSKNSSKGAALEFGRAIHAVARKRLYACDLAVGNTILNMYGKCGSLIDAEHVFEAIHPRNIVTWNAMISAFAEHDQDEKALMYYREMQKYSVTTDDVTLIFTLKSCCVMGCLNLCNLLHFDVVCAGYETVPSLAASLIHAYGSSASLKDANACLDQLAGNHVGSWNACITCYAGEGNCTSSLHLFENLRFRGYKPDGVTFTSVISACSHSGFVNEGQVYYVSMSQDHEVIPEEKHYGCMLDLLARAGNFTRVVSILSMMPMEADTSVWLSMLGACQTHGNVDIAEFAFDSALKFQPKNAAAYVALSNVYANAGHHAISNELNAMP